MTARAADSLMLSRARDRSEVGIYQIRDAKVVWSQMFHTALGPGRGAPKPKLRLLKWVNPRDDLGIGWFGGVVVLATRWR